MTFELSSPLLQLPNFHENENRKEIDKNQWEKRTFNIIFQKYIDGAMSSRIYCRLLLINKSTSNDTF